MKRVVIVGSGGREHALALALADSAEVAVTPGNAGIPGSVATPPGELDADLFIIGPEAPLVEGLADELRAQGKLVFGPGMDGSALEASKVWMKLVLDAATVPTARWEAVKSPDEARGYLGSMPGPFVVKTSGLASGGGVLVTSSREEAIEDACKKLSGESFGIAGTQLVLEEYLSGQELSVTAICNGKEAILLPSSRDYKRLWDGDQGPNTGGMGAFSPVPALPDEGYLLEIVERILGVLRKRGIDYRGILYVGLMLTAHGPKVLEVNVRFGDPEAQAVLSRITGGLLECLMQAAAGEPMDPPTVSSDAAVTVVLASRGYPEDPRTGYGITGIEDAEQLSVQVLHAGTRKHPSDSDCYRTAAGRVLNVAATAPTVEEARVRAYAGVAYISWIGVQYRRDIAQT